jgi:uncharacterized membrane protein YGL010W
LIRDNHSVYIAKLELAMDASLNPAGPPDVLRGVAAPDARKVDRLLAYYATSHQNPKNEAFHFFCIPAIMLSLVGMIYAAHPWAAYAFVGASIVWYTTLSWVFTVTMLFVAAAMFAAIFAMGSWVLPISAGIFVVAWVGQFIGHKIEGKKPSFFDDIKYLWVGPLYCFAHAFRKLGIRW